MGWMNRWQKRGSDQPKQLLYFAEQQLENEFSRSHSRHGLEGNRVRLAEESAQLLRRHDLMICGLAEGSGDQRR